MGRLGRERVLRARGSLRAPSGRCDALQVRPGRSAVAVACGVTAILFACVTLPETGQPPTGEPLGIQLRHHRYTARGDALVFDPSWRPMQGGEALDDEDFFRIAGDDAAADAVAADREQSLWLHRLGLASIAAGIGCAAASASFASRMDGPVATGLAGGTLLTALGGALVAAAWQRLQPDHHPIELSRAHDAAAAYNARMGYATEPLPPLKLAAPPTAQVPPRLGTETGLTFRLDARVRR